jgi:hypothetical protein
MSTRRFSALLIVLAAAVFAGVWLTLRAGEADARLDARRLTEAESREMARAGKPIPIPEIARSLRAMKLVTVEVETAVTSRRVDESWRGNVAASVVAPVRLLYGCDLSGIGDEQEGKAGRASAWLRPDVLGGGYTLRVPRPARIATEVEGEQGKSDVRVGWARFRDLAGEYQLGLARSGLYQQARLLRPTEAQRELIEQTTRDQLTRLVRAFAGAGEDVPVRIEFFETDAEGMAGALESGERR